MSSTSTTESNMEPRDRRLMNALKTLGQIFVEPDTALRSIRQHSQLAVPMLLSIVGGSLMWIWYYNFVDMDWLRDSMLEQSHGAAGDAGAAGAFITRKALGAVSVAATSVGYLAVTGLVAAYFRIVGKSVGVAESYRKWFAFAVWTAAPSLLLLPLMAARFLWGSDQVAPEQLDPLTLNALLLHLPAGHAWKGFADAASVLTLWSAALMVVGLRAWGASSISRAVWAVVLPHVAIFGAWAALVLARSAA